MSSPLDRLLQQAARRAAGLPTGQRLDWIAHHSLFQLADDATLNPSSRKRITDLKREVEARNRMLLWHCQDILGALEGVDVLPLKGIYLLDNIYSADLGSRVLSDIDLMVPVEHLDDALARLSSTLGFLETGASRDLRRFHPHSRLKKDGLALELHTRLAVKHIGSSDWAALSPHRGQFLRREVHLLDDETNLVYMICHLVKHGPFYCLKWVTDILCWMEIRRPDPMVTLDRARDLRAEVTFMAGIRALRQMLGGSSMPGFPTLPLGIVRQQRMRACEATAWRAAYSDPMDTAAADSRWKRNLAALLLADDGWESARFFMLKAGELISRLRATGYGPRQPGV